MEKLFDQPLEPVDVKIEESWKTALAEEFRKPYFHSLVAQLKQAKNEKKIIYPPGSLIFNAFKLTPIEKVKVVILGQDPYKNPNEAMGLSFSVPRGVKVPPSLRNIYKEIHDDLHISMPNHGDLTQWAERGVFLLNAMLTVEHKKSGSHKKFGWQNFTNAVIKTLSDDRSNLVFMLWGNFAREKRTLIDRSKHLILEAPHPSPLAHGFNGCKHFSKANAYLQNLGHGAIDWSL